jgi:hypothetical protein
LLPDSFDAPIRCELFEASLDDAELQYQAVSYAWGDASITQCIECNGLDVDVTVSLGTALQAFRHPEDVRIYWADALCINQANSEERNRQVSIMGDIYRSASRVLVWLGVNEVGNEDAIQTAFRAMEYVSRLCPRINDMLRPADPDPCSIQNLVDAFVAQGVDDIFAILGVFYDRPYWKRTWCIQEVYLARELDVWLGRHTVSGDMAGTFTTWLSNRVTRSPNHFPINVSHWMCSSAMQLCMHNEGVRAETVGPWGGKMFHDFLQVLSGYRHQQVTDKRDRIYGLLGIAGSCHRTVPVEIDYNKSYEAIIQDLVKDTIRQRGNLGVLGYAGGIAQDGTMPSWVPRWDLAMWDNTPLNETMYYAGLQGSLYEKIQKAMFPSRALEINPAWFSKDSILELPGVVFDHVGGVSQRMKRMSALRFNEAYIYLDIDPVARGWFTDMSKELLQTAALTNLKELPQEAVFKLATTLTGGATSFHYEAAFSHLEQLHPLTELGEQYMKHFWAFAKRRPDPERPEIDGRGFNFMAARACMGNHFIVTSKGEVGLVRSGVKVGDIVVVLHGGYYPFILRRSEGAAGGYTLLGGKILCCPQAVGVLTCLRMLCVQHRQGRREGYARAR